MTASSDGDVPLEPRFTAAELRAAVHLVDPALSLPDRFFGDAADASPEAPWLLTPRLAVALTVVSDRIASMADAWLAGLTDGERADFERERALLMGVARGELPPPGLGP